VRAAAQERAGVNKLCVRARAFVGVAQQQQQYEVIV